MLYRPAPVLEPTGDPVDRRAHFDKTARRLIAGETLVVRDHFRTAKGIIESLVKALRPPLDTADHATKAAYRDAYRSHAWRLLAPIEDGEVALPGAPKIGFLSELYPDLGRFWLPVPEIRDLSHAWYRYEHGVPMPVLGRPLHPFYGAYLPTRTTHLELFATWLSGWSGARGTAIDVGTGSGVIALMLARKGFEQVHAIDINPNAVESVRREVARSAEPPPITVQCADLLSQHGAPADLIVFNPPWTLGRVDNNLDRALNYDDDLFERFFEQAQARLKPEGRVAIVFSNVIRLLQPDVPHPIDAELDRDRFRLVATHTRRIKPTPGKRARRTRERVEVWELAHTHFLDAEIQTP